MCLMQKLLYHVPIDTSAGSQDLLLDYVVAE